MHIEIYYDNEFERVAAGKIQASLWHEFDEAYDFDVVIKENT